jgi:cell wall-associated NlpC family hydrolase
VLGETASIIERNGEWRHVCTHIDSYNGWVHAGYLSELGESAVIEWRTRATGWSQGAVLQVEVTRLPLPLRARVVLEGDVVELPDGRRGRLVDGSIGDLPQVVSSARTKAPEHWAADHFLGSPYQWGGVTPWGVDCSGLVQTTFLARGITLPRDSAQQVSHGEDVPPEAIRPGDLLFFRSESGTRITHVAFAGEGETLVHSTLSCGGMLVEPWSPGTRAAGLRSRLVAVRRLEGR